MSELKIQFQGWQAIVVIVVIIGIIIIRFVTLDDMMSDQELTKQIDTLLMNEYAPHVANNLREAYEEGGDVGTVLSTKVNILSVQASYPIFKFSTPKDVVVKVVFSLDDDSGTGEKKTIYYLFKHGVFGWHYQYITTSLSYYLNFM